MSRNDKQENIDVDQVIRIIKDIGKSPYLLTPDLVVATPSRSLTYFIMEMGEISLVSHLKKAVYAHEGSCPKENDHIGLCHSGLSVATLCQYFVQIAQAILHLHEREYTHGDIKSANIMIMPGYKVVKLIDLDFLKKEETKKQCGSFGYVAPEVVQYGNVLKVSDVFSLTLLIPEMFFGVDLNYVNKHIDKLEYLNWLRRRNDDLYKCLYSKNKYLAYIFQRGTEMDHGKRPSISQMISCFKECPEMRNQMNSDVEDDLSNIVWPQKTNDKPLSGDDSRNLVAKKIIEQWMNSVVRKLPARLPFKVPMENTAGSILYDDPGSVRYDTTWTMDENTSYYEKNDDRDLESILG